MGTIVFFSLFAVLAARMYTTGQRRAAEEARALPLVDDERRGGVR